MNLRKLKSFSVRHYDTNEVEKREKRIWRDTSNFQKFIAILISWLLIGGFTFFIVWILFFAPELNNVNLNGYSVTQKEYDCLTSGGNCKVCVIEDINGCSEAVEIMHSETY